MSKHSHAWVTGEPAQAMYCRPAPTGEGLSGVIFITCCKLCGKVKFKYTHKSSSHNDPV